jgi:beta-galactosidase
MMTDSENQSELPQIPAFPFGAVYFRKSNPPKSDWERDYRVAREDGMNCFRHWLLWSAVEPRPGEWDWADYDQQLELASQNGIKTILAEMMVSAPEWAYKKYSHARLVTSIGEPLDSIMSPSCAVGGFPGLCLDHEDYRAAAGNFLRQAVIRYQGHPGLAGYDLWNECGQDAHTCYCPATAAKFQKWLQAKYSTLQELSDAWKRYGYLDWSDIYPPHELGPYPHVLDWFQFRLENAYENMEWRVGIVRSCDPYAVVTAHGVAGSLRRLASDSTDDWRAASKVQIYGYTWGSCRHGDETWKQFHAADLVRAASDEKPFWHAEAYAGPLWMQPQVLGKPRAEGRIPSPADIRYWNLVSMMAGARGLFYLRWRPLLDGPLFGAFGPYGLDGSRTERSRMSARIAKWVEEPKNQELLKSKPVKGDCAILVLPDIEMFSYAQHCDTAFYSTCLEGAYQGFFDANIQADWISLEKITDYDLVYFPYPVMLTPASVEILLGWVESGGTLVCEGCPGYWTAGGQVNPLQPGLGLNRLFGIIEDYVEFTPDLLTDLRLMVDGTPVWGGLYLQSYQPVTAASIGWYEDGRIAACDHRFGAGQTRLIGTMCSAGYNTHPSNRSTNFFHDVLQFAGKTQHVTCSHPRLKARLQSGPTGTSLWVANPLPQPVPVCLRLSTAWGPFSNGKIFWGEPIEDLFIAGRTITLTVPARDVAVILLAQEPG